MKSLTLTPPEGVPVPFEIASLTSRIGAQLLDIFFVQIAVVGLLLLLRWAGVADGDLFTLFFLLRFLSGAPYYVLSELVMNGRTLGKRIVGVRVVAIDGRTLRPSAIAVRNLMREAEIFLPLGLLANLGSGGWVGVTVSLVWLLLVLIVPLFNKRNRRLGDLVAGTVVVVAPAPVLLPELARPSEAYAFTPAQLDMYGAFELQTLEKLLQAGNVDRSSRAEDMRKKTLDDVAQVIRRKIGWAEPVDDVEGFLRAFYSAQRAYLEKRQIFGDARADKHHKARENA